MIEELKPCPFCGSEAEIYTGSYHPFSLRSYDYVYCKGCGVTTRMYDTEREAAEAWNKCNTVKYEPTSYSCRACKNATDEEIKRLKSENARLQKELNEAMEQNYKNAFDIQQQAERGAKYAQKENARLREALEEIDNFDTRERYLIHEGWSYVWRMQEIAKKALKGGEE